MSQFSLAQPLVLLVLIAAAPLVVLLARSRLRAAPGRLRLSIIAVRLVVAALLVVALARPRLAPAGHGRAVVFAIDVSDSVSSDQQQWARDWVGNAIGALSPGSQSSVIEFGGRAELAGPDQPPTDQTDLGAALRLAGSVVSRAAGLSPEIVLVTDGWSTTGSPPLDVLPAGVAVSYVALPSPTQSVAVIHSLNAPSVARSGDRVDVQLDVQSTQPVNAQLRLMLDQATVADGQVHLEPGNTQVTLPAPIGAPGFASVRAELTVAGQRSTLSAPVVVKPAGRILILQDEASDADALAAVLADQGLDVVRQPASSLPPKADALSQFDGAVLVNTPATSLTLDQQRTLQAFVQDMGRGLLVIGGRRAFSPGGYEGTPLDDMLPVSASPPIEPQQGGLALFLVIDRSGSMDLVSGASSTSASSSATKMAMAREAAIEAAGLLQPQDTLGVIAFDSSFDWVVPPTRLQSTDDIKSIQSRIATVKAGGGTSILPPLEAAYEAAAATDAPLKHIVLMTDGESNDRGYEDLLGRMAAQHITLSALAIGSDADTKLLTSLAHLGGGRYYFTERSTQIPRIAGKETSILTRNAVIEGQVAAHVADPSPIVRSISGDLPPLTGFVATTRKDRAVTALETEGGQPLLAHWQYGLGRVVAWTSDAQEGWASAWSAWPDAAQFWSQAVRWALPAPVQADFQPSVAVASNGRDVTLAVQALEDDGHFADLQDTRATVLAPDGSARELVLPQRGPGLYSLDTSVSQPGEYRVLFKQGAREEVAAFSAPDAVERHSVGTNTALLDQLAITSGGHALSSPADLSPGNGPGPVVQLWPWFLLAGLLLLPVDVFLRRRA